MNRSSIMKYAIGAVIVIAVALYIVFANDHSAPVVATATRASTGSAAVDASSTTASGTPSATSTATSTGQYNDGTYTGSVADAFYGNLQVSVTIQGGVITGVQFLQAPHGGNSTNVSNMAEPALTQEALAAQSANVNVVSGATQDSEAFQQSLAAALAQAKNQ